MKHQKLSDEEISRLIRKHSPLHKINSIEYYIKETLLKLGAVSYNFSLPETRALPFVLRPKEQLLGIVYGRYHHENDGLFGRGAFVATDQRVLLVDKKPFFLRCDETAYEAVKGVAYGKVGFAGTVSLNTSFGNMHIRTFNQRLALNFVNAVEKKVFQFSKRITSPVKYSM